MNDTYHGKRKAKDHQYLPRNNRDEVSSEDVRDKALSRRQFGPQLDEMYRLPIYPSEQASLQSAKDSEAVLVGRKVG